MLQVAGDGYKRGQQRLVGVESRRVGQLVSECHTSTIVDRHYVTRVTSYEEEQYS